MPLHHFNKIMIYFPKKICPSSLAVGIDWFLYILAIDEIFSPTLPDRFLPKTANQHEYYVSHYDS